MGAELSRAGAPLTKVTIENNLGVLFVGEAEEGTSRLTNFFASSALPDCAKGGPPIAAVDESARKHLGRWHGTRRRRASLQVEARGPGDVLAALLRHQGGFVEGEKGEALDKMAALIHQVVSDVAAGAVIAEAKELGEGGRARFARVLWW